MRYTIKISNKYLYIRNAILSKFLRRFGVLHALKLLNSARNDRDRISCTVGNSKSLIW